MRKTLIYISSCAVHEDGRTDPFLLQELPWLMRHFDRVQMVSYYGIKTLTADDGDALVPIRPLLAPLRAWIGALFQRDLWRELGRLRRDGKLTPVNALKLLLFEARGRKMHFWTERLLRRAGTAQTTLYACWMSFDGYAAALSKRKHPDARFVARGHAFDIDRERNPMNPYLMKQAIADAADGLYLISECARAQFMSYMEGRVAPEKVRVLAMGSGGAPLEGRKEPPLYTQGVFRVVSCAMIIEIKQVHLMVEALAGWRGAPLHWTHIGGGEGEEALRALAAERLDRRENVIYDIMGFQDAEQVQKLYASRAFDVFVNTSRKEGVPVSIMEAMRYGIPVIAPNVGGIPELTAGGAGFLYAPEDGAEGLRQALERFALLPRDEAERMRGAAQARWNERYCSQNLLPRLFPEKTGERP